MFVRAYTDADRSALLDLWQRALPLDGITANEFDRRVILDPNRERESLMLAFEEGKADPLGFVLCLVLQYPIAKTGLIPNRGFMTAFGVDPARRGSGVGSLLLEKAEEFFRKRQRNEIAIAPYTPNYFVPGIDKERYADGIAFLQKRGFSEFSEAIAMDALCGKFEIDQKTLATEASLKDEGITIEPFRRDWMCQYLEFMDDVMPGPWLEDARHSLVDMTRGLFPEDGIMLARHDGRIIGYCQHVGEHFGPFGVVDGYQGKGIGTVLLARTLYNMRLRGHHAAFVLWTGERAAQGVYGRLGFEVRRRFALVRKNLTT